MSTTTVKSPEYEAMKQEKTISLASNAAMLYASVAGGISLAGVFAASKLNPSFNRYMGISAKTSIPVMIALFVGGVKFELKLHEVNRNPEKYGFVSAAGGYEDKVIPKSSTLSLPKRTLNFLHDHPFQLVAALGIPFVGAIASQQMKLTHLTISQRVMHSRVIGQAGVVTIAMSVMAFRDYMDKHGKFE